MSNNWNQFFDSHGRFYLSPHESLIKFINICKSQKISRVLDMGCGSGRHVVKLAEEGFDVSGIDFSPSAASLAENWLHQKNLDAEIIVGNFDDKQKDFPDNSFGGVIAINTLEYGQEHEIENNLSQIKRYLKPDGLFLLVYRSKLSTLKHPNLPVQFFEQEDFKKIIEKYFEIDSFEIDKNHNFVVFAKNT